MGRARPRATRREFLGSAGGAGLVLVAGCTMPFVPRLLQAIEVIR